MSTIGSLFSGIGGLELGLEWAGLGPTLWQVEIDPFCRSVLARHWPEARRYEDVREVSGRDLAKVDILCGGFPCQDVSSAGARKGLAGSRSGLWHQFARIAGELRAEWVVVENVASGAKLWVDAVASELEQLGYAVLPVPMRADWVGAPYPRARVFIVGRLAHLHRHGEHLFPFHAEVGGAPEADGMAEGQREAARVAPHHRWSEPMPQVDGVVPGAPGRVAYQRMAGNCVIPNCAEVVGWMIRELS